jgi:hypothetical protein
MNKLEKFGEILMKEVRDNTSEEYLMIKEGRMRSEKAQRIFMMIESLDQESKVILDRVIGDILDRTLHNLLYMFEQSTNYTIVNKKEIDSEIDMVENSDGISGELYGDKGWFLKYSKNLLDKN